MVLTWLGNSNVLQLPVAQAALNYKAKKEHTRSSLGPLPHSYCERKPTKSSKDGI